MRRLHISRLEALQGEVLGVSQWIAVDQAQVDRFADLSGDRQWIHVDVPRAAAERGGTIAHALLVMALMSTMTRDIVAYEGVAHGVNYGFDRLRFPGPAPTGARIRMKETLVGVERKGEGLLLRRHCEVEVEGRARPAAVGDWLIMLFPSA